MSSTSPRCPLGCRRPSSWACWSSSSRVRRVRRPARTGEDQDGRRRVHGRRRVPRARADHAHAIADLALRIRDHVATNPIDGRRLSFRIGINSGPVTAGVIGTRKFSYDLWGDTVNTASRMESEGVPGSIQVSPSTFELIKDEYTCEACGSIRVKGKSEMETYLLISKRDASPADGR